MDLRELQEQLHIWRTRNFPDGTATDQLLGVGEEVGELMHHHLKDSQKIRANEDHYNGAIDSVGDIVIYLMGYCSYQGWNIEGILDAVSARVLKRNWVEDPVAGGERPIFIDKHLPMPDEVKGWPADVKEGEDMPTHAAIIDERHA